MECVKTDVSNLTKHYEPQKNKSNIEQLNDIFNHIRCQLDFLCQSADYQNKILKELYDNSNNRSNQS